MSLQKLMGNYAAYNAWANETLIQFLKTKAKETWTAEVPSSFNSIAKTIDHILATEEYWYAVIMETDIPNKKSDDRKPPADGAFETLVQHSKRMATDFSSLSDEELQKEILIESPWFSCKLSRYEYIQQVLNHSTYHRGQITTIGRNLGFIDAPNTDYNFYNVVTTE